MLFLNAEQVRQCLSMSEAIDAMRAAFAALAQRRAIVPQRTHLDIERHRGVSLAMPAYVQGKSSDGAEDAMTVKVVSLFEGNRDRGLARIQAIVTVFDPTTGQVTAQLEGATITSIRTGAASGLATDLMAREDSRVAAVFGAGVQARTQLEAVCTVRTIEEVFIFDPDTDRAQEMAVEVAGQGPIPGNVCVARTPKEAIEQADIVCTVTTAHEPVFDDIDLKRGVHINAVGSYQPHVREIPTDTIIRSRLVVDHLKTALSETGDLIQPIASGAITAEHIHTELGDLVLDCDKGRTSADEVTLFKSVGNAVQDALAAKIALQNAAARGIGQPIQW